MTIAAAIGALGSVISGIASFSAGAYQAKIAQMNAQIANENANRAIFRSQVEQQSSDAETLALLGAQEAAQGASGINLNSRSARLTRKTARELGRQDALNIRQAGEIEAYNYRTQAENFRAQGSLAKMQGTFGLLEGFLGAGGSLVGASKSTRRMIF